VEMVLSTLELQVWLRWTVKYSSWLNIWTHSYY